MTLHPIVVLIDADLLPTIDQHVTVWRDRSGPAVDVILEAHPGWTAEALYLGAVLGQVLREGL